MCSCFQRNKNPQTVKLPRSSVGGSLHSPAGQICYVLDADAPKPPTYPFRYHVFKERSSDKIFNGRYFLALRRRPHLLIFRTSTKACDFVSVRHRRCFASVRRCLRLVAGSRKGKKRRPSHFFRAYQFPYEILGLMKTLAQVSRCSRNIVAGIWSDSGRLGLISRSDRPQDRGHRPGFWVICRDSFGPSPVLAVIPACSTSNRGGQDEFTSMESGIPQPAWGHTGADA